MLRSFSALENRPSSKICINHHLHFRRGKNKTACWALVGRWQGYTDCISKSKARDQLKEQAEWPNRSSKLGIHSAQNLLSNSSFRTSQRQCCSSEVNDDQAAQGHTSSQIYDSQFSQTSRTEVQDAKKPFWAPAYLPHLPLVPLKEAFFFSNHNLPSLPPQHHPFLACSCHGYTCICTRNFCLKSLRQAAPDYISQFVFFYYPTALSTP